ncbi:Na(+)-translocating NADH-quinone reductase subunit F [Limihaloglobus sulfuriphilus]|uniref:Na(+)-translocating NADH-quinone reductase subunit F n=1 Tax=Limihaloglobus sulfuriphilus TaxID=1851148 RepID=A0A1Q2MIA1_9BACT|nr:ASKHA domain-containing protein [Limihaloglobus sulfuriphilus]AQQ72027.1 Na(+)-translocating NADH-quinone reductase subunit F [Limihaloglobus sulfuriphilus]
MTEIIVEPSGKIINCEPGQKLSEALSRAGIDIPMPCGGAGTCGKCLVRIIEGHSQPQPAETKLLTKEQIAMNFRLACQTTVTGDMRIRLTESRDSLPHQILTDSSTNGRRHIFAAVKKTYVELPEPSLEDGRSDLRRLCEAVCQKDCKPPKVGLKTLRRLPAVLREAQFKGTATVCQNKLIDFEPGDTTDNCYGVAVDIGTTTVAAAILDLTNGDRLAVDSALNPQVKCGDDVVSRINYCGSEPEGLKTIQTLIVNCMRTLIQNLCEKTGVQPDNIYEVTIAGNTTMEQLFTGVDPKSIGEMPFVSTFSRGLLLEAEDFALPVNEAARVYLFPIIGGFVGGDTSACILSSEIYNEKECVLMVDIGTNGEIILLAGGKLYAASTAAGPALEGARISKGMRAAAGAIDRVNIENDDIAFTVIGGAEPVGICGSALIDAIAILLEINVMNQTGQMISPENSDGLPPKIAARITKGDNGQSEFLIAQTPQGEKITLTQKDVREFQLAVGAIRAGVNIMLKKAGVGFEDVSKMLLAGGFGSFIRRSRAQRAGLLPLEIDREKIDYIGNASLAGAELGLLSIKARDLIDSICGKIEHIELSLDTDFQMEFASAMIFPG